MTNTFKKFKIVLVLWLLNLCCCSVDAMVIQNPHIIRQMIQNVDIKDSDLVTLCRIYDICSDGLQFDTEKMVFVIVSLEQKKISIDIPIIDCNKNVIGEVTTNYNYDEPLTIAELLSYFDSRDLSICLNLSKCEKEEEYSLFNIINPIKYDFDTIKRNIDFKTPDQMYYLLNYEIDHVFGELTLVHETSTTTSTYKVRPTKLKLINKACKLPPLSNSLKPRRLKYPTFKSNRVFCSNTTPHRLTRLPNLTLWGDGLFNKH